MRLTKDIEYDKDLVQGESFTLRYSGSLFSNNSNEVYIVYGYDKDWKNTTEQKMKKVGDGFVTKINLLEFSEFNFCFKNSLNEWDNNNTEDYHLPIEAKFESNEEINKLLDSILSEIQTPKTYKTEKIEIYDQLISQFDSIFNEQKNENYDLIDENYKATVSYFESLFDKVFESYNSPEFNLETEFPAEFTTDSNETKEEKSYMNLSLTPTSNKKKSIFAFENLSPWYVLFKRVRLALYKLFVVLPNFLFGEEDEEN